MSLLIDRLTDGPSELHFQQLFEQHLQQGPLPCALLYVNIKRFHSINAIYGREIGDWVLQTVYHIFAGLLHEHEQLSRIHTDTFLLLLTAGTRAELEERILQFDDAVYSHQELQRVHRIFFSMGAYLIEGRTDTYAHAVDCANYSRISSSDCADENTSYEIYGHTVLDTRTRSLALLQKCGAALERHHFQMYLQPKYELETEQVAGAEALVRWHDPDEGMIPLSEFMPPFEESGFIRKIDYFIFESVLQFLQRRLEQGLPVVPISLNLSKSHFSSFSFFEDKFIPIFQRYHVPAGLIEFELSESLMMDDHGRIRRLVEKLAQYGFGCSLDDFGSGFSCLNTIKTLPISVLKLDKKMFTEEAKERGKIVVQGILQIAKGLGMTVVSEGVETREYVDFLKLHGGDLVQGYYFSRPLPAAEFEALLTH